MDQPGTITASWAKSSIKLDIQTESVLTTRPCGSTGCQPAKSLPNLNVGRVLSLHCFITAPLGYCFPQFILRLATEMVGVQHSSVEGKSGIQH